MYSIYTKKPDSFDIFCCQVDATYLALLVVLAALVILEYRLNLEYQAIRMGLLGLEGLLAQFHPLVPFHQLVQSALVHLFHQLFQLVP